MMPAMKLGLISDTHGRLDAAVHDLLAGVDELLHAGDVCGGGILEELAVIAPVHAVAGNCDMDPALPATLVRRYGRWTVLVKHILGAGRAHEPSAQTQAQIEEAGADIVLFGHSHRPEAWEQDGVLFINPGSVSDPRGYDLALATLELGDQRPTPADVRYVGLDGYALEPQPLR